MAGGTTFPAADHSRDDPGFSSGSLEMIQKQRAVVSSLVWALPILTSILAISYEIQEHVFHESQSWASPDLIYEISLFGVVGPFTAFFGLKYMHKLADRLWRNQEDLRELNQGLQKKVAQRTAELETSNAELRVLDEMKSEFVSLVSHSLKAPLTSLSGGLEVALQKKDAIPSDVRKTLGIMQVETDRLMNMVQRILDISRFEGGRLDIARGPIALRPILNRSVEIIIGGSRPVVWDLPKKLPIVLGDEAHLEEAIRMVLDNAHRYAMKETPIEVSVESNPDSMSLAISDHGPGIPNYLQKRIFEKFYRATDEGDTDENAGWGLGLYLARRLLDAQGGTLSVDSPIWPDTQKGGAKFTFTLPLDVEEEAEHGEHIID